ncbi:hypothetical protein ASPZODRAFT_136669 [Penicilliopsis zonata CBS 506.65]|uniref:Uncharacterized protein n=1 Tax=Penicilliopsis zonata CBS 506.65 TaxID=1073090 RepID=A0A1L9S7J7_9EURO|nr:hypothetical protein ASPZODRAFT_136669 [Penicilliopsis zonata CBS 506.65]OJJ43113.1 hypothetical protein ASPZODRAFT_136669 [Penicilliopsis zonata CBS 506.65]
MDFMPGKPLDQAWPHMTSEDKTGVANHLHGYISQLRGLKGTYIQAASHGKAVIEDRTPCEAGPFFHEKEFNEFLFRQTFPAVPTFWSITLSPN